MTDTIDPRFLDKRTAERYMRLGLLDEKAWEKYLKSLPDVADKSAEVETAIGADEDADTDEGDTDEGEGTKDSGRTG
jgi:hypothetical protein